MHSHKIYMHSHVETRPCVCGSQFQIHFQFSLLLFHNKKCTIIHYYYHYHIYKKRDTSFLLLWYRNVTLDRWKVYRRNLKKWYLYCSQEACVLMLISLMLCARSKLDNNHHEACKSLQNFLTSVLMVCKRPNTDDDDGMNVMHCHCFLLAVRWWWRRCFKVSNQLYRA